MIGYIKDKDVYALFDERETARLHVGDIDRLERVCFPAELHVGDRAWKKAMSILDKKYAEAKKLPFIRDPVRRWCGARTANTRCEPTQTVLSSALRSTACIAQPRVILAATENIRQIREA